VDTDVEELKEKHGRRTAFQILEILLNFEHSYSRKFIRKPIYINTTFHLLESELYSSPR